MSGIHSASEYIKTALVILLLTGVFILVSYFAPYWTSTYDGHAGLWIGCMDGVCFDRYHQWISKWIRACQAFMTMSLVTWFGSMMSLFFFVYHRSYQDDARLVLAATICGWATALFTAVAVMVWSFGQALDNGEMFNFCYFSAWGAVFSGGAAAFFLTKEMMKQNDKLEAF